ncbi:hypothetical protein [Catenuloplanes japonicus]|uniref:hypothetical protein n=1 Tax=Catenuloplanes japonicus TaxID=33876 RepID=UPI0005275870|nr:hypothetical protein [Catenuloplanes japonicus]
MGRARLGILRDAGPVLRRRAGRAPAGLRPGADGRYAAVARRAAAVLGGFLRVGAGTMRW